MAIHLFVFSDNNYMFVRDAGQMVQCCFECIRIDTINICKNKHSIELFDCIPMAAAATELPHTLLLLLKFSHTAPGCLLISLARQFVHISTTQRHSQTDRSECSAHAAYLSLSSLPNPTNARARAFPRKKSICSAGEICERYSLKWRMNVAALIDNRLISHRRQPCSRDLQSRYVPLESILFFHRFKLRSLSCSLILLLLSVFSFFFF